MTVLEALTILEAAVLEGVRNYNSTLDYGILAALVFLVLAIGVFIFVVWKNKHSP
jgi:hypothetical protein